MYYIIQENVFKEHHYDLLTESLNRLGLQYTTVRVFPFVDKIVDLEYLRRNNIILGNYNVDDLEYFIPPSDNVFVFGSLLLARIGALNGWKPSSMMNINHDFNVYKHYYQDNLLNYDSKIYTISDKIDWDTEEKFLRPCRDTKAFEAKVYTEKTWEEVVIYNLHNFKNSEIFNEKTTIQVTSPKIIKKEIRFWIVGGKIITYSQYMLGNAVVYDANVEDEAIEFAQKMIDIYQLADAFVIDICLTENGWKIVECNCINCAGFYHSNIPKMIMAVDDFFNNK